MKYYIAYGSNLNIEQMLGRCQDAVKIGSTVLPDYELLFRGNGRGCGVATIERKEGSSVPVGIWAISESDEKALDIYEGYPYLYRKQVMAGTVNGKQIFAMAYVMTPGHKITPPSGAYLDTIAQGYDDFRLDQKTLMEAVKNTERRTK